MKKAIKITSILLMVMMFIFTLNSIVMAAPDANSIISNMDKQNVGDPGVATIGGKIVSIITTVGIVISVIILVILGIKYMIGSASEKAEYKKSMIPYIVGAILVFGASAIAKVVVGLANNLTIAG